MKPDVSEISIHALTRSATKSDCFILYRVRYFNPRTHKECDVTEAELHDWVAISIHALTRSAIEFPTRFKSDTVYFNPRTHKECDWHWIRSYGQRYFNPRTHKECDIYLNHFSDMGFISIHALTRSAIRRNNLVPRKLNNFNPRTHKECDLS